MKIFPLRLLSLRLIIRRKALWSGVLGPSMFWRGVAVFLFGRDAIRRFFGKQPESLGTFSMGTNAFVNVITAAPMTAKERKRAGITKQRIVRHAVADVAAARPGRGIRVKT